MQSRRIFLGAVMGGLVANLKGEGEPAGGMIVLSTRPEDLEMPLSGFDHYITPVEQFFVRTHVSVPQVDIRTWRLRVEVEVSSPLTLSLSDLRRMKSVELVSVLECAG